MCPPGLSLDTAMVLPIAPWGTDPCGLNVTAFEITSALCVAALLVCAGACAATACAMARSVRAMLLAVAALQVVTAAWILVCCYAPAAAWPMFSFLVLAAEVFLTAFKLATLDVIVRAVRSLQTSRNAGPYTLTRANAVALAVDVLLNIGLVVSGFGAGFDAEHRVAWARTYFALSAGVIVSAGGGPSRAAG